MADQGDHLPGQSGPPGIVVTPAEGSPTNEVTESSRDWLQVSHDTEDDGALPKVQSEEEADANPKPEDKPLVSPEDDEFEDDGERRPVSPVNDDEDEKSVTSSHFSDSDSDEETRGRARRSPRDGDMSSPIPSTSRFAKQTQIDVATAERRRSQEGITGSARREATKPKSPLAIKSITRDGDNFIVTSPTYGTVTLTDPRIAEELDKSTADGTALVLSQDVQDVIEQAFHKKEILRLAETYKHGAKHTPPPVPERPGSPQFGLSSADAEAQYEDNNPAVQQASQPGLRAPAETGYLGHRRSASADFAQQALLEKRYRRIQDDLRRAAVDPNHNVGAWDRDALWGFMRVQDNKVISITEVLHKNDLKCDVEGMITLQEERKFARSEVKRIKSEYDRQTFAIQQRTAELEAELLNAEEENARLWALQDTHRSRESVLRSDSLSPERQQSLEAIDSRIARLNDMQENAAKRMKAFREQLDNTQELREDNEKLEVENRELRDQLSQLSNQIVFFEEHEKKTELKINEQKQAIAKFNRAYTTLDRENTQLRARVEDLQHASDKTDLENAELKGQLEDCLSARSELAKDKSGLKPVEESSTVITIDPELEALKTSNPALSGKITALEKVLIHVREDCARYKELYIAANEQRVWSLAHYAAVKEPWPVPTRELIAPLFVRIVNDNRKPVEESKEPADVALNGRSARDLQFELTGLVEDLPLSGMLTTNQVVQWFAAGLGVRKIFEEIRSLDLHLDNDMEEEILRVLIEQGWCYGNFDVFASFVFSDRHISRSEFVLRVNDIMAVLDRIDKDLIKTETDLDIAQRRVAELEQREREQSKKIGSQAHELRMAEISWDAIEEHHGNPEGTLEQLIELQIEHEDLKARYDGLAKENAYYESELADTRQELDSTGFNHGDSDDKESCTVVAHRGLEARIQDLEKQKQELAAAFSKHMAESQSTSSTQNDLTFVPHDYWAELLRLRRENDQFSRDLEIEAAGVPNSPACEYCSRTKRTNAKLLVKLREAKRNAASFSPSASPSDPPADGTQQPPPYCDNCLYLTRKHREAEQKSNDFEDKLRVKEIEIRSCRYQIDTTKYDLAEARKEIESLMSGDGPSSPKSTSTGPTSVGSSPAKSADTEEVRKLRDLNANSQQLLSERIADSLMNWGATKLAAPPADQEKELFDSFDTESNARKHAIEKAELEKQNAALQKNLDDLEATASQLQGSDDVAVVARIENLKRQVDQIPGLQAQILTLTREKERLIVSNEYLMGQKKPECCGNTRDELQKEIEAHAATKNDAVAITGPEEDEDPCADVKQELQKTKDELSETTNRMSRKYNDLAIELDFTKKQLKDARESIRVGNSESRPDEDTKPADVTDPCKDVKDELAALKLEHQDTKDLVKDISAENEKNKRDLREARINASRAKPTLPEENKADDKKPAEEKADNKDPADENASEKDANEQANLVKKNMNLIKQICELEKQIRKARDCHLAQAKIEKLTQQLRDSAVKIEELKFEVGKLEATSKAYRLAGDRHGPPANDDQCKDAIKELIGEQTKLKDLIDTYKLDAPPKKSTPVEEKKEEPKTYIGNVLNVFKKITPFSQKEAPADKPVEKKDDDNKEEPAPEPEEDPEDDPCSIYKKQFKDVKKQVDAFEKLTLFKEKFLKEQETVERRDKEIMQLKSKLERLQNDADAPWEIRKRLNEAVNANRKQADIIECNRIVAAQHHKEMTAFREKLAKLIALEPDAPMKDLMDRNQKLQKEIDRVQGKFLKHQLKTSQQLNFLGKEISILYAERDNWRGTKVTEGLWQPAGAANDGTVAGSTTGSPKAAETETSGSSAKTTESPAKTTDSAAKTSEPATSAPVAKPGEDFRGTPENPWPRITYDCWPEPSARLQESYEEINKKNDKEYKNPTYVLKVRVPRHPAPDITGLWTAVHHTAWKLPGPKKMTWFEMIKICAANEYFLPGFWVIVFLLDYFGHDKYTVPTLDFIFGRENGSKNLAARWTPFIIIFFGMYTWWLQQVLRSVYGKKEEEEVIDPLLKWKPDPCREVKKELEKAKTKLEEKEKAEKEKEKEKDEAKDKGKEKKDESKKDSKDSCKDVLLELADKAAKFDDAQARLNGEKSVIDWKNDKRSAQQWQQVRDTRFWEAAGIPGPLSADAVTYEEFLRRSGLGLWSDLMRPWDYRTPAPGNQLALRSSTETSSGSESAPSANFSPGRSGVYPYTANKSALADAWKEFLERHPELSRFTRGFIPWIRDLVIPGSVNMNLSINIRRNLATSYGIAFPSHGELTAWRASQGLLPPTEQELAATAIDQTGNWAQIPAHLRSAGPLTASTTYPPGLDRATTEAFLASLRAGGVPVAPAAPAAAASAAASAAAASAAAPGNANATDPCKGVKDKLAQTEKELEAWKHRQWKFESDDVKGRCKQWYEEWRAKSILYDPVRRQLTDVEDQLEREKKEHKAAKEELAKADPKTIKTNKQQLADAKAQEKKLAEAKEEAEKKIKEAEKQTDQSNKRAEEFRRALEVERERRLNAPTVEDEEAERPNNEVPWLRFWATLILSIPLSLQYYRYTQLDLLPEYQNSTLSTTEILWYDTVESTRQYHTLITVWGIVIAAVLLIWGAALASAEINPWRSYDSDSDDDDEDNNDDNDNGGDGKGDDGKGNGSNSKKSKKPSSFFVLPYSPLLPFFKRSTKGSKRSHTLKNPLSLFPQGTASPTPTSPKSPKSPKSSTSPKSSKTTKVYNTMNPLSWFPLGIAPATPTSPKAPLGFQTTRQQTWKHSHITSVSTKPSVAPLGTTKSKEVKELEDRLEKCQQKLTMTERQLLASRAQEATFTQSGISSIDLRPQAGPNADQKRRTFKHSAISSISTAPKAAKEAAKTTTDGFVDNEALKAELAQVKKQLRDANKQLAANNGQSWNDTTQPNEDWEDPCKSVKDELERVKLQLKQKTDEIKWMRKQRRKEEKEKAGVVDDENDDSDDEDGPPPGSLEMSFLVAKDMVKIREAQLEQAADDLRVCHEATKTLRNKFYDARDGWDAEKKKVEELKKARGLNSTSSTGTQTSSSYTQASSGDVDHSECNKRINELKAKIDALKEQSSKQDDTIKQELVDGLTKKVMGLESGLDRADKELNHYKDMYNRADNHGLCLRGGKREIIETQLAEYEKNGDQRVAELLLELKAAEEKEKKALEELKTVKEQLADCQNSKKRNDVLSAEEKVARAEKEAEVANKELADWVKKLELNKTWVLENPSPIPEVAKLQREIFEKNDFLDLVTWQKANVEEKLQYYQDLLKKTQDAEDHDQCRRMEKLYKQQAEAAEKARDEAADTNRKQWLALLAEQTKAINAKKEKDAAEKKAQEAEKKALEAEKEKEALTKQLENKNHLTPETTTKDEDSASQGM